MQELIIKLLAIEEERNKEEEEQKEMERKQFVDSKIAYMFNMDYHFLRAVAK